MLKSARFLAHGSFMKRKIHKLLFFDSIKKQTATSGLCLKFAEINSGSHSNRQKEAFSQQPGKIYSKSLCVVFLKPLKRVLCSKLNQCLPFLSHLTIIFVEFFRTDDDVVHRNVSMKFCFSVNLDSTMVALEGNKPPLPHHVLETLAPPPVIYRGEAELHNTCTNGVQVKNTNISFG